MSVGDVNLDGYGDILAGLPGEDLTRSGASYANAGQTLLLRGASTGPTGTGSVAYSQDTSGVPDHGLHGVLLVFAGDELLPVLAPGGRTAYPDLGAVDNPGLPARTEIVDDLGERA
ncbi:hypothetical protein [Streptomyces flavidovirens]|uniref:Integrin-like protein n=1 Tax=Streptomyces flavidovirens TaxID=67298 RepID=A0ABW6RRZ7_9ACTN